MKYVVGNWKMHATVPESVALAGRIEDGLADQAKERELPKVVIAPSFPALSPVGDVISGQSLELAAQDAHWADHGPHTGEVSPTQLKDLVGYVIIGHPERRRAGERDEIVARKLAAVVRNGLTPILYITERERGGKTRSAEAELESALTEVDPKSLGDFLVVYEPAWAPEAERPADPELVGPVVTALRKELEELGTTAAILYGGHVDKETIGRFKDVAGLDGVSVGEAALADQQFLAIVERAA